VTPLGAVPKVMVWLLRPTVTFWPTSGATPQVPLPAWSAAIVQVPAASRVRAPVVALTVQTSGVVELYVTARPEEAPA